MTYASSAQPSALDGERALSLPLYGASFAQAFGRFWKKYATFSGRASRSEYWWFYLANALVVIVLYGFTVFGALAGATVDAATGRSQPGPLIGVGAALLGLWWLATLVPYLAIAWRRLHDTNRSGGFWFLGLVPFVGGIILIVLLALDTNPAGGRFDT